MQTDYEQEQSRKQINYAPNVVNHYRKLDEQNADRAKFNSVIEHETSNRILNGIQTGLDVAGLIPGFGEAADGLNALIYLARGDYANAGISAAAMVPIIGWGATGGKIAGKVVNSSAHLASEGANLSKHLSQLQKYGQAGFKELQNGRFRYYGDVTSASKAGEMVGRRVVREWNPANGRTRTWMETLDGAGNTRIVRPETGGDKVHFMFGKSGNFIKKW